MLLLSVFSACTSASSVDDARAGAAGHESLERAVEMPIGAPLIVRGDVKLKPGAYVRPPLGADAKQGVIVAIDVKNATIDLAGVELRGTAPATDLDKNEGFGILLERCENVTIRGGKIGGYKDCIVARECKQLVVDGVEFDGWYGMRLRSTAAAEDPSDWLYPHENDHDEWIDHYGSAIALTDCTSATVSRCRGRHGQNGVLLVRSSDCRVFDDDFSFLSGWGLALYRSSNNVVSRNAFDYCVRGYSHGVYWRGQDSAGILMFERCSDNLFALNSATHGGDGLFLFAGNDIVLGRAYTKGERDPGGSDRNIWYRNDFSYAVANAIEATFSSDNWAIENRLDGSHQHGVWGGYSRRMVIAKNEIEGTIGGAISIEHGQECAIVDNTIAKNDIGVELWWNENKELVGGPFGAHHDTASRDHWIEANAFSANVQDVVLEKTTGVAFARNRFAGETGELRVEKLAASGVAASSGAPTSSEGRASGARSTPTDGSAASGKIATSIDQAKAWMRGENGSQPSGRVSDSSLRAADDPPEFLKRARAWTCPDVPGSTKLPERDDAHGLDAIVVGEWGPWDWKSGEPKPTMRVAGGELAAARWDAVWFSWRDRIDPRKDAALWRKLADEPLARKSVPNFTDPWGADREIKAKVGADHFGLVATTKSTLREGGHYRVSTLSDDGVRVSIDGVRVIDDWTWHAPTRDEHAIDLAAGEHEIEVEYFQIDGALALSIELVRAAKP
jgi:nitrous oxidase accessory protein NosD